RYFQGKENSEENKINMQHTAENHNIPYMQRYIYVNPSAMFINPEENAVYVVNSQEKKFFNGNYFSFVDFNGFTLVTPIKHKMN
ncbi:MAG TPA: hypothetical protein VF433_01310, partial [Cellvibrio sp.]